MKDLFNASLNLSTITFLLYWIILLFINLLKTMNDTITKTSIVLIKLIIIPIGIWICCLVLINTSLVFRDNYLAYFTYYLTH